MYFESRILIPTTVFDTFLQFRVILSSEKSADPHCVMIFKDPVAYVLFLKKCSYKRKLIIGKRKLLIFILNHFNLH